MMGTGELCLVVVVVVGGVGEGEMVVVGNYVENGVEQSQIPSLAARPARLLRVFDGETDIDDMGRVSVRRFPGMLQAIIHHLQNQPP